MIHFDMHIASGESRIYPPSSAVMEAMPTLRFTIEYPLTNPFHFNETHDNGLGWTEVEFADAVRRAYTQVYESEPDPGHIPGMLNRGKSEGAYGIWGHDLGDLYLEGAVREDDGSWRLLVGS